MRTVSESPLAALQEAAIERLGWAGQFIDSILGSLSDDQLMSRPEGRGNHPIWVMGHIVQTRDFIVSMVSGEARQVPTRYDELFAGGIGTQPSDDRSIYPSPDELRQAIRDSHQRVIGWVKSLDETTAYTPVPEPLLPFAPNAITVPFTIVAHDCFHLGQVATVRAVLGLEPVHR